MFDVRGDETADALLRKQGYLRDARQRWGLQDCADLSGIGSAAQLIALLEVRLRLPLAQIKCDVESWMEGKRF
jgi:hypothetical protein